MLEKGESKNFEIVLQVRNLKGEPTGRTKSYSSDSADEISGWYDQNKWKSMRAKPKQKAKVVDATNGKEGERLLKEMLMSQENN